MASYADPTELAHRAQIRSWLYFSAFVLLCLVVVGGATRLTDSGLSITEWKPIHGFIPPLSAADWAEEFAKYKLIPEYELVNKGMSLTAFKTIFWWEWAHRFLARSLGIIVGLPLVFFWVTGRLDSRLKLPLVGLFALGGLQGFIGWWMVSSGLTERVDVSHYRLATHLCMAALIMILMIDIARSIAPHSGDQMSGKHRKIAGLLVLVVLLQIGLGALVAGLDAGMVYNQWPYMGEGFFPSIMWEGALGWHNWVENHAVVQFVHRTGAYVLMVAVLIHAVWMWIAAPRTPHAWRALLFFVLVLFQATIGILTLLTYVKLDVALSHQALAFILVAFATAHWRGFKGALPLKNGTRHTPDL